MPNGLFIDHSQWFSTSYVNPSKASLITVAAAGVGYAGGIAGVNKTHNYSMLLTKKAEPIWTLPLLGQPPKSLQLLSP